MKKIPLPSSRRAKKSMSHGDSGQVTIFVVLAMALFLIGFVGFAVDMTNLWFHRQMAQGAADAACQAGVMDLLYRAQGTPVGPQGQFATSSFDCNGSSASPCWYAATNGYNASTAGQVVVSFPGSVGGVTPPPSSLAPTPFIRVDVTDTVSQYFSPLITRQPTQDVRASAVCAVVIAEVPIPIIILDPLRQCTFVVSGTGMQPKISILGGPTQSVQVNSIYTPQAACANGNPIVDLSRGGPTFSGSDFGVYGGPSSPPFVFNSGATGNYLSPRPPISDPFATLPAPAPPGPPALGVNGTQVGYQVDGCPDPNGCRRFSGGRYPAGITVGQGPPSQRTAIFDPGLYYLDGPLDLASNSTVRPSTAIGDGSGGTTFFFAGASSVSVSSNSGARSGLLPFNTSDAQCPGGLPYDPSLNLPPTIPSNPSSEGANVLLGPCAGPYGQVTSNPTDPEGPPLPARGILFFQNRATGGAGEWGGGGDFLLAGTMYFHQCNGSGTGVDCLLPPAAYNSTFTLQGNACSDTYILGNIVTDKLIQGGTPCIKMSLDPYAKYTILKATLVR
jgi:Flp pilus assembly protein TadG